MQITQPFYLGATEVTVGQFRRFVEATGYRTEAERDRKGGWGWDEQRARISRTRSTPGGHPGFEQTDEHPVVNVSWNDAVAFCTWLGRQEGWTYRLPTEAEWEYACRAGTTTRFECGDDPEVTGRSGECEGRDREGEVSQLGNHRGAGRICVHIAGGAVPANGFGLFDMHGNVWEWCSDWYDGADYRRSPPEDRRAWWGPRAGWIAAMAGSATRRCRSADRSGDPAEHRNCMLGFRLALGQSDR